MSGHGIIARRSVGLLVPLTLATTGQLIEPRTADLRAAPSEPEVLDPLAPRETTDSVARIIFSEIRGRLQNSGMTPQMVGVCERLVSTASGNADVQREIFKSWEQDPTLSAKILKLRDDPVDVMVCGDPKTAGKPKGPDNLNEARSAIRCPVCLDPLRNACILNCEGGHVLCGDCIGRLSDKCKETSSWMIVRWLRSLKLVASPVEKDCPICRRKFNSWLPVKKINEIVESIILLLPDEFDGASSQSANATGSSDDPSGSFSRTAQQQHYGSFVPLWIMEVIAVVVVVAVVVVRARR